MFAFSFFKPATARGWLQTKYPGLELLSSAWNVLYHAQRGHMLATTGPCAERMPRFIPRLSRQSSTHRT
jgi:hypothetical protein